MVFRRFKFSEELQLFDNLHNKSKRARITGDSLIGCHFENCLEHGDIPNSASPAYFDRSLQDVVQHAFYIFSVFWPPLGITGLTGFKAPLHRRTSITNRA